MISIAGRSIGSSEQPYLVAELSANHHGDLEKALQSVEAASRAGADALKIQTYTAAELTIRSELPDFKIDRGPWAGRTLYDLYEEAHLPWEWIEAIFRRGEESGLTVFSSAFHESAVDFLEELGCPAYKIASFEIGDTPLIRRVAATGKPVIISTGMAATEEIDAALHAAQEAGATALALLHCISAYPAPVEEANLLAIPELMRRYGVVVGLSDHTMSNVAAVGAVVLGAAIVEKHFTLDRDEPGPDTAFSTTPDEFTLLATSCRAAWAARGDGRIGRTASEQPNVLFRRSLYVTNDVRQGEVFTEDNVRSIRPGFGLPPHLMPQVLGKKALRDLARGTPLRWADTDAASTPQRHDGDRTNS